jgi:predicted Zn-dependent peptidase
MFGDREKIFSYTAERGKEDLLPSYDRMKEILAEVEATPVDPSYPEFKKVNLDVAASNVYTTGPDKIPAVETFGNGAQIRRLKSEPVKAANHVAIKAVFNTGLKALPQDKISSARVACAYIDRNFGFRNYSRKELRDSPQTGNISTMLEISRDEAVITLHCGKEDTGNAFQLLYLLLTEPYFDTNKNLERFKTTQIKNLEKERSSKSLFDEEDRNIRYDNHPWRAELTAEDVKAVDMPMVKDVFARAFGDPGQLTVYVCDDLSDQEISGLYSLIGSLPVNGKTQMSEQLPSWPLYKGKQSHVIESALKTVPKSEVSLSYKCDIKVNNEEYVIFDILDYIMDARCMNKIREERGGTYSVTFTSEFFPRGKVVESTIAFQTRPEIRDILIDDAKNLMAEMAADGPTKDEFENARKYLAKHHSELQARYRQNLSRKLNVYMTKERYGIDKEEKYIELLEKASIRDVRKMAAKIAKGDSMLSVYTEN